MEFNKIIYKDDEKLTIRSFNENDALKVIEYKLAISRSTEFMNRVPSEVNLDELKEQQAIKYMNESNIDAYIGLFIDDRIIGVVGLYCKKDSTKLKHRCGIGISIDSNYRHKGFGKILLENIIDIAKGISYEQMELEVVSVNEPAIRLYTKAGFIKVGHIPNAYKIKEKYYDFDIMVLDLKK